MSVVGKCCVFFLSPRNKFTKVFRIQNMCSIKCIYVIFFCFLRLLSNSFILRSTTQKTDKKKGFMSAQTDLSQKINRRI